MLPRGTSRLRSRTATWLPKVLVTPSMTTTDMEAPWVRTAYTLMLAAGARPRQRKAGAHGRRSRGTPRPPAESAGVRLPNVNRGLCLERPLTHQTAASPEGWTAPAVPGQEVIRRARSGIG